MGENVSDERRGADEDPSLLSGVETPDDPLKTTSSRFEAGEVIPLDGDLDLSRNLEE